MDGQTDSNISSSSRHRYHARHFLREATTGQLSAPDSSSNKSSVKRFLVLNLLIICTSIHTDSTSTPQLCAAAQTLLFHSYDSTTATSYHPILRLLRNKLSRAPTITSGLGVYLLPSLSHSTIIISAHSTFTICNYSLPIQNLSFTWALSPVPLLRSWLPPS